MGHDTEGYEAGRDSEDDDLGEICVQQRYKVLYEICSNNFFSNWRRVIVLFAATNDVTSIGLYASVV